MVRRTAQLEAANKDLEAFSYSVSHDLRAPLRTLCGYSGIVLKDCADVFDAEGKRLCGVIISESQRMGALIDHLLNFSRLRLTEMQKTSIERIDFRMNSLHPAAGDAALIRQVWINLLSNTIKFSASKEQSIVEVGSTQNSGEICYSVRDNGAGFDMRYADKLFGVFKRLHSESEFEGTGVGLAIVQSVISRHGGGVWGEGKTGEGAVFYFTLPEIEGQK